VVAMLLLKCAGAGVAAAAGVMWLWMLLACWCCWWRGASGHLALTCPENGGGRGEELWGKGAPDLSVQILW
jgi:hypothetical protein